METLDGTDFSKDDAVIARMMDSVETQKANAMKRGYLEAIPEEKNQDLDADGLLKKGQGKNAAGG